MSAKTIQRTAVLLVLGIVGWGVCGGIIFAGRGLIGDDATFVVHAIAVPIVFGLLVHIYFRFFTSPSPRIAAAVFLGLAAGLDFFIIAPFAEKSYAMFTSPDSILGTWIPFGLIFLSAYLVGLLTLRARVKAQVPAGTENAPENPGRWFFDERPARRQAGDAQRKPRL